MSDLNHIPETPIDKAIFKVVASRSGGTQLYNTIVAELKEEFTPKKVTLMLYGNTTITAANIDTVYSVLRKHDTENIIEKGDLI